jgi:aldose 1-epimerase
MALLGVLGYRDRAGYGADQAYLGALAGRHANRIAGGRFKLDDKIHQLTLNEHGRTHPHGGLIGFSRRGWLYSRTHRRVGDVGADLPSER